MIDQNLSADQKQYRCRHCLRWHDLHYTITLEKKSGRVLTFLQYRHPTYNNKSQIMSVTMIKDLPIPTMETGLIKRKHRQEMQTVLF